MLSKYDSLLVTGIMRRNLITYQPIHYHGFCTNVHLNSKSHQNDSEILAREGNVILKKLTGDLVVKIIVGRGGTSGRLCGNGVFVQEFFVPRQHISIKRFQLMRF